MRLHSQINRTFLNAVISLIFVFPCHAQDNKQIGVNYDELSGEYRGELAERNRYPDFVLILEDEGIYFSMTGTSVGKYELATHQRLYGSTLSFWPHTYIRQALIENEQFTDTTCIEVRVSRANETWKQLENPSRGILILRVFLEIQNETKFNALVSFACRFPNDQCLK